MSGLELEGPMVDYARKGNRVRLVGPDQAEGIPAWKIEVTTRDGTILQVFVDAERFLEIERFAGSRLPDSISRRPSRTTNRSMGS